MLTPGLRGGTALTFQLGPFSRTRRGLSSLLLNLILYCLLVAEEHAIVLTLGEGQEFWEDSGNYSRWNSRRNSGGNSRRLFKKDSSTKVPEGILDRILKIIREYIL